MASANISAETRTESGKGVARKLRAAGRVPGVIYGHARQAQSLSLGASHLDIPANAVCDLASSSYGVGHWEESCTPQTDTFTIRAVVRNAATDHPSVDFEPALRFSPDKQVGLYLYVTNDATLELPSR